MVCVLTTSGKTHPTQRREDGIVFAKGTRCGPTDRSMVCVLTTSGTNAKHVKKVVGLYCSTRKAWISSCLPTWKKALN